MLSPRWLTLSAFWFSGGPAYPDSITRRRPALFPITHRTRFETHDRPRANRGIQAACATPHARQAPARPAPALELRVCVSCARALAPAPARGRRAARDTSVRTARQPAHPAGRKKSHTPQRTADEDSERRRSRHTQTPCALTSRRRTSHAQVSSRPTRPGPGQRFFGVHGSAHADQASLQQQRLSCCLRDGRPAEWAEQLALQVARRCTRVDGRFHSVLASTATARAVTR